MAGSCWVLLAPALALLLLAPQHAQGNYIITTPRQWISPGTSQLCVFVTNGAAPAGNLNVSVTVWDSDRLPEDRNQTILTHLLDIPAGKYEKCHDMVMPKVTTYSANLHLKGSVNGLKVNDTVDIRLQKDIEKTFVQTDKFLYRPGEKVQFRVLTVTGNKMKVSTAEYPEAWVNTPSRTRIAQWKNVSNTDGLVHLDFQLADEPEEGYYTIFVKTPHRRISQSFKVEEFVLPRFEVTIKTPKYILATDDKFSFTACANYTYGQPVKGNLSFTVHNNQNRKCHVSQTTNVTINGCHEVVVSADEMKVMDCSVYSIGASALLEEEGTGVALRDTTSTTITRTAVKFKTLYKDEFMKPNIPYSLKMRAELPDGTPASGVPVEVCAAGFCNNDTTATDGILNIVLPNYKSNRVLVKAMNCRAGMRESEFTENIEHYFSPSNSSLQIIAPENKLKCSPKKTSKHTLPILFSARDMPSADLTVQIISRGHIQHTSTQAITLRAGELPFNPAHMVEPLEAPIQGTVRGVVNLEVTLPPTASPKAKVLIWYSRADGEVVSDVRELEVDSCLANNVTLDWSTEKAQPGEAATLTLKGEPLSVCSLGVVDRSVELLARDPDPITMQKLFNFADSFTIHKWTRSQVNDRDYCNRRKLQEAKAQAAALQGSIGEVVPIPILPYYGYYSSYVDALKMFSDAGVYVLTDLTVETRPCEKQDYGGGFGGGGGAVFESAIGGPPPQALGGVAFSPDRNKDSADADPVVGVSGTTQAPRTNFPESWLWDLVVVPASGTSQQQVTVPDTITQWVGKAVCVHPEAGVGLSDRKPITTFTPFFVDLTLPPTIKRGETLPVKMSIFNYHDQALPVSLTLDDSIEYEILQEAGETGVRGKRSACVPPNDKAVLTVRVRPEVITDMNLTVSAAVDATDFPSCGAGANSPQRRDALIRPIKVEADGFPREVTWNKYICSKDFQTGEDSLEAWNLTLPATLVEGSARGWVTAVGDLLALSLENLGHLIRMPYGCGEQNMLNFAPNIYLLRYLDATRQATPDATRKLKRYMNTGYQRQLLYRRSNGSYSAFGNADDSGSTWLSAFVLKSFTQAKKYIQMDDEKLNQTRGWLMQQQGKDGCFIRVGKVLHKSMQGGVSNSKTPAPLTAYVLMALLEGNETVASPPVDSAIKCINKVTTLHPYTLALKAYALALAGHAQAPAALKDLMNVAVNTTTTNSLSWKLPEGSGRSRAASVEVAGYAILAMMTLDPKAHEPQARKVVKWLTTQRNGQGGFYSTQDTVVALQALALYESNRHQGPLSVSASVTADGLSHTFSVNDGNKLLTQLQTLPTLPTTVTLGMTGEGCAVLQAVLRYNIPTAEPSDVFDLTVNTITVPDRLCVTKRITACASYTPTDGASNMVVIEVNLISGYIPEKEDLKRIVAEDPRLKRYEVDGSKINFYVDELRAEDTCVNFRVTRAVDVENVKPGTVVVYDYYQEEFSISMRYTLPPNDECR